MRAAERLSAAHLGAPAKKSFVTLFAVGFAMASTLLLLGIGFFVFACSMQISYYKQNASRDIPVWKGYGMPNEGYQLSQRFFEALKLSMESMGYRIVPSIIITVALAAALEYARVSNAVAVLAQIIFFLTSDGIRLLCMAMFTLFIVKLMHKLLLFAILGVLWYFVGKKIGPVPSLLYALFLVEIVFPASVYYTDVITIASSVSEFKCRSISLLSNYPDIGDEDRTKILEFCESRGIHRDEVFVLDTDIINAAASSGPRYQFFFFTTAVLKLLSIEQLLGMAAHEIEHIRCSHIFKDITLRTIARATFLAAFVFAHCKLHKRFGALLLMIGSTYARLGFTFIFEIISNVCLSHRFEYQADSAALESAYGRHYHDGLLVSTIALRGKLFDYKLPAAALVDHPSILARVRKCEQYFK
ncbi:hypothetical protein PAPHI01_1053 [Pancytospora philotis]|nr:hypothetical protein PAPHI01_1053 [Pancytospora philotis]